jgi:hypothetical protein
MDRAEESRFEVCVSGEKEEKGSILNCSIGGEAKGRECRFREKGNEIANVGSNVGVNDEAAKDGEVDWTNL